MPGDNITATVKVKNTGKYAGKETVQFYISKIGSAVERADKELKAFKKVMIVPGETATVTVTIPAGSLAYFDAQTMKWVVEPGDYQLLAGTSSRGISQTVTFTIHG